MSCRDPFMDLADQVLENLSDWWVEFHLAEPRAVMKPVKQAIEDGPGKAGGPNNPVATLAGCREDLLCALKPIRRRVKKLKARLRQVYRLKYREGLTYPAIADALVPKAGIRSVERYVEQIRNCVAGTLRRQNAGRLALLWRLVEAQKRWEKDPF